MNEGRRPGLFVVRGGAQGVSAVVGSAHLSVLPPPKPTPPLQLGLPAVSHRSDAVLSLGMRGLEFSAFAKLIREHVVRRVFDLRVSPSFRGDGFSVDRVAELFSTQKIQYRRLSELVSPPDDSPSNAHVRAARYEVFLKSQRTVLLSVRALINTGPVLLLGWESEHAGSDRAILVDALQEVGEQRFELVLLS